QRVITVGLLLLPALRLAPALFILLLLESHRYIGIIAVVALFTAGIVSPECHDIPPQRHRQRWAISTRSAELIQRQVRIDYHLMHGQRPALCRYRRTQLGQQSTLQRRLHGRQALTLGAHLTQLPAEPRITLGQAREALQYRLAGLARDSQLLQVMLQWVVAILGQLPQRKVSG